MKRKTLLVGSVAFLMCLASCNNNVTTSSSAAPTTSQSPTSAPTSSANPTTQAPTSSVNPQIPVLDEVSVQIHYQRKDNSYDDWCLWLWTGNLNGEIYDFNYRDDFGAVASYPLSTFNLDPTKGDLEFIVRRKDSWTKDVDMDRLIDFDSLEKDENDVYHIYLFSGDKNIYSNKDKTVPDGITSLHFMSKDKMTCTVSNPISGYKVYENDELIYETTVDGVRSFTYELPVDHPFKFENTYNVEVTFKDSNRTLEKSPTIQQLYNSDEFNEEFYYDGDLGALFTKDSTTFRVWSPVSNKVVLKIYENGTPSIIDEAKGSDVVYKEVEMTRKDKGVFETVINENLAGKYYTYTVYNGQFDGVEICDPYAKSTGVNGIRGMIVDFEATNPTGWEEVNVHQYDRKELTVWETHVVDVTSSSTWNGTEANRRKYLGLIEEGTTYTEDGVSVKTGFDHIKELGVNAVQFIPIFDQANDEINTEFNWGYNPLNYNTLEGSYSSNPHDGYARIREFKQVVQAFNEEGINIIMDVVYNHVNGLAGSNFDVLVPGYYFRYDYSTGKPSNGSGCGNETASENPMYRKFMIDSASFWAEEYKLGGFRFDLMALHDLTTMNELTAAVKEINPSITIYGEPWNGGSSPLSTTQAANQNNGNKFEGFGQFNDRIRDELIKGGLSAHSDRGWVNTNNNATISMNKLIQGIKGYVNTGFTNIGNQDKTVTYVTCHDNYTLYDRMVAAGVTGDDTIKKMAMLANSVVFTSQGTSFMLAGEEMLRTKQGDYNSYASSYEVNELDYSRKIAYNDMFKNYQSLIDFKINVNGLHLSHDQSAILDVKALDNNSVLQYVVYDTVNHKKYMIIHSNGTDETRSSIDLTGYTLYLDTLGKLNSQTLGLVTPEKYQTIIAEISY